MKKITPHLWFNRNGAEAASFYTSLIPGSHFEKPSTVNDTPSGNVEIFQVNLAGMDFQFLSAGAEFKFTPAISFLLACTSKAEVDRIAAGLADGGSFLMPLASYPFSGRYAWVVDRFGLSWQVMLNDIHAGAVGITPTLMFVGENCGKAEEAVKRYVKLFPDSSLGEIDRYGENQGADKPGTVRHLAFRLAGVDLAAMDSAQTGLASFTEAISFIVSTEDQEETDLFWDALSADPGAEACGWLKDSWGLSWQIVPTALRRLMSSVDPEKVAAVTKAFLKMKKLNIAELEKSAEARHS
jgi:predicted 3-demethylubiquinone-9 3-methyltransferase (glyoxalase superfamily)